MPTVLITGARAPAALELARAFARKGWKVLTADTFRWTVCSGSKAVTRHIQVPSPRTDFAGFCRALGTIPADLIVPTCEEVFFLAAWGDPRVFAPPLELLWKLHSKWDFLELAAGCGVEIPVSQLVTDVPSSAKGLVFKREFSRFGTSTYIAKLPHSRTCGRRGIQSRGIRSEPRRPPQDQHSRGVWGDPRRAPQDQHSRGVWGDPRRAPQDQHSRGVWGDPRRAPQDQQWGAGRWIVQELLTGQEFSSYGIAVKGELTAFAFYEPIWRIRGAASVCFRALRDEQALAFAQAFAAKTSLTGQFGFDFIRTSRGLFVLECNPRATSGVHLLGGALAAAFRPRESAGEGAMLGVYGERCVKPAMLLAEKGPFFWSDFWRVPDVVSVPGDRGPALGLAAHLAEVASRAIKGHQTLQQAATHDIEWDGEPIDVV